MNAGGAERVAANLANGWASKGHRVTLLVTYSGRGGCFYPLSDQVEIRYLADDARTAGKGARSYVARFLALRGMVRRERPDLVVSFLTNVNVAVLLATLGNRIPTVVCEHTYPPQFPVSHIWSQLRRWTYPLASRVTMLTSEGLQWLRQEIPLARGVVMPNPILYPLPVNAPRLAPESVLGPERKMLLAVGRLSEEKGFGGLIDAFSCLASQHLQWDLVILGEGPVRSALTLQIQSLGLGSRVFTPGRVGNVGAWYERADLYVLSSRVEGFPNTLGEAMAHGCAAVSFDCDTGPRELIRHDIDGLLVPPCDVAALAQSLCRLMQDDSLRARMAARALEVRDRYSMERVLALWEQLIANVTVQASDARTQEGHPADEEGMK